ncbi:hypothetical protein J6253_01830 [bacterium]|nr:hypothetical protein [bacterium]MBP5591958.1 hypothetical protein [bacterium]
MKKISFYVGKKNFITFAVASVILLYAIYAFSDNVIYFFSNDTPIDLGDALELNNDAFAKVKDGDYVQIKGITSVQGGNIKKGVTGERHVVYYLNGSSRFIIDSAVTDEDSFSGPHYRTVKGRAFAFKTNSRAAKMQAFFANSLFLDMKDDGFFIEDGVIPRTDYAGLFMFAFFALLMILNIVFFIKPMKRETRQEDIDRELDALFDSGADDGREEQ